MLKSTILHFKNPKNWFHEKSEWYKKSWNFHTMYSYLVTLSYWTVLTNTSPFSFQYWLLWHTVTVSCASLKCKHFFGTIMVSIQVEQGKPSTEKKEKLTKKVISNIVEISLFLYHSYFTWNQFWGFLKYKISHFNTFRGSEFWFFMNFALIEGWNLPNQQNSEPLRWQNQQF